MTAVTWGRNISGSPGVFSLNTNWVGNVTPVDDDDVIFDGTGISGCIFDTVPSLASVTATAAYAGAGANDGHLDNATNDQVVTSAGDVIFDNDEVSMGDALWPIDGNWDNKDVGTFNPNLSTVKLTGTTKTIISKSSGREFHNLIITGSYTSSNAENLEVFGTLDVDAGTLTLDNTFFLLANATGVKVQNGGTLDGSGILSVGINVPIDPFGGTISVALLKLIGNHSPSTGRIAPGTYDSANVEILNSTGSNRTFRFDSGTYIFKRNVKFQCLSTGDYLITNDSNPNLVFEGNVSLEEASTGTLIWTKGTGTVILSGVGSGTKTIDFLGKSIEDLVIDDPGATKQLIGDVTTESFTGTAGTLEYNGNTVSVGGSWNTADGFLSAC